MKETLKSDKRKNEELSASLLMALDVRRAFEIYTFRLGSPEEFCQHMRDLAKQFIQAQQIIDKNYTDDSSSEKRDSQEVKKHPATTREGMSTEVQVD